MISENATPAQREAIETKERDVLLVAGPGSGKTATLVARIERLLREGVDPATIAVLTFTNAAAGELQRRLPTVKATPEAEPEPVALGFIGTLHSFCLRLLKEHGAEIGYGERVAVVSPESSEDLIESKARSLAFKKPIKELLELKKEGRPPRGERLTPAQTVIAGYFDDLKEAGVVDYDVLLTEGLELINRAGVCGDLAEKFLWLFVDEVQDSAPIDWMIYRRLPFENKFFVGDPDQAIYGFRGGRVREMIEHAARPSTHVIKLQENFRSRSEICAAANLLIRNNRNRVDKITASISGEGGAVSTIEAAANEGEEIGRVTKIVKAIFQYKDEGGVLPSVAILARTNAICEGFRTNLEAAGVPVVERKVSALPRDWPLARAFVSVLIDPDNDSLAFFYLISLFEKKGASPKEARDAAHAARNAAQSVGKSLNAANLKMTRVTKPASVLAALAGTGISREAHAIAVDKFRELPSGATVLDFALALGEVREYAKDGEGDGVRIMTIHGAKGREFDVVFVVGFEDQVFPGRAAKIVDPEKRDAAIEEERRLAYVAITRARNHLYVSSTEMRTMVFGRHREHQPRTPSRFLAELQGFGGPS